jgi:hypothetical protein
MAGRLPNRIMSTHVVREEDGNAGMSCSKGEITLHTFVPSGLHFHVKSKDLEFIYLLIIINPIN